MYCPTCRDEFRSGFTRCQSCNVDLVERLDAPRTAARAAAPAAPSLGPLAGPLRLVDFCGFLALDEARQARDRVRARNVRSEIAIRESPQSDLQARPEEEYWLRVDIRALDLVTALLGYDPADADTGAAEPVACRACGHLVAEEETFCPRCGARFDAA